MADCRIEAAGVVIYEIGNITPGGKVFVHKNQAGLATKLSQSATNPKNYTSLIEGQVHITSPFPYDIDEEELDKKGNFHLTPFIEIRSEIKGRNSQ